MSVHIPSESVERAHRPRFFDWRFLVSLAGLIVVCLLVWASIRNYDIRADEAAQKDALITQLDARAAQVEDLQDEVSRLTGRILTMQDHAREDRKAARVERRSASRERGRLLRQQATMIRLLKRWGVVPRGFTPARSVSRSAARTSSSGTTSGTTSAPRTYTAPRTSTKPKPAPTAGKSGKTPGGKAKGLGKP